MFLNIKLPKIFNPVGLFWIFYTPLVILGYYELFTKLFDKAQ